MKTKPSRILAVLFVVLLSFCSLTILNVKAQEEDSWTTLAPMQQERYGLGVETVKGRIYAIGGNNGSWEAPNITEEYDPETNTWSTKAPMPGPMVSFASTTYNNKIYCFGYSETYIYNPTINSWEQKTPIPNPRYYLTACTLNDKIYVIGGTSKSLDVYDPKTDSWTTKAPMLHANATASQKYSTVVLNGKIHVIGGYHVEYSHQIYDPETDTWSIGKPLLKPTYYIVAEATTGVNAPKRIYVFGGDNNYFDDNSHKCELISQSYDTLTESWTMLNPIPRGHLSGDATNIDDKLYVIGGAESETYEDMLVYNSLCREYTPIGYDTLDSSPEPFPTKLVLASSIIVALVGIGILVYFKKRRLDES